MRDPTEIFQLLHIAKMALEFPKLAPIHSAAMSALEKHAEEFLAAQPIVMPPNGLGGAPPLPPEPAKVEEEVESGA